MKRFLLICMFLFCCSGWAYADTSVRLGWNANTEDDLDGYRLYSGNVSGDYSNMVDIEDETLTGWVINVHDGVWYFALSAYDRTGNESGKSSEVNTTTDSTPPNVPGLRIEEVTVIVNP